MAIPIRPLVIKVLMVAFLLFSPLTITVSGQPPLTATIHFPKGGRLIGVEL